MKTTIHVEAMKMTNIESYTVAYICAASDAAREMGREIWFTSTVSDSSGRLFCAGIEGGEFVFIDMHDTDRAIYTADQLREMGGDWLIINS